MALTSQFKEEFYVRRLFDDEIPLFVDITRCLRVDAPYELSTKKSLKATCGVRTDDEVVAFSLRNYTSRQAEREVETVQELVADKTRSTNLLRPYMPRRVLAGLNETARALAGSLGDGLIVELGGELFTMSLTRSSGGARLQLTGRLVSGPEGYEPAETAETAEENVEFELPISGLRLRIFMRSPVRDRILAYAFSGYLARKPGELETLTRATALALNGVLGLATFKLLSRLDHVEVPSMARGVALRVRTPEERVAFRVPVLLFTQEGTAVAYGDLAAELDLDHVDPVTGGLLIHLSGDDQLVWNPDLAELGEPAAMFAGYADVLNQSIAELLRSVLGEEATRDAAYDIMLSDVGPELIASLRIATESFPRLAATPSEVKVQPGDAPTGQSAA